MLLSSCVATTPPRVAAPAALHLDRRHAAAADAGLGLKAAWIGAEQLGKLINIGKASSSSSSGAAPVQRLSRAEALEELRKDYAGE